MAHDFNKDMNAIKRVLAEYSSDLRCSIYAVFDFDKDEFVYSESGFASFLYDIVNWDLISLCGGRINIRNSNHEDVAKIMKRWATKDMVDRVYNNLYV